MTNHWVDIKNADIVLIMGGNAAEAHPCGFKWVTEAKAHNKAKLIVVDPRFTRSASVADFYAQIGRASCRERVCQYGLSTEVAVSLKKKTWNRHVHIML